VSAVMFMVFNTAVGGSRPYVVLQVTGGGSRE
jgi:hypothetical protein